MKRLILAAALAAGLGLGLHTTASADPGVPFLPCGIVECTTYPPNPKPPVGPVVPWVQPSLPCGIVPCQSFPSEPKPTGPVVPWLIPFLFGG